MNDDIRRLAWAFYSGVPWSKLTAAERSSFHRYQQAKARAATPKDET